MLFTILGMVTELERSLIQERVKAGGKHAPAMRRGQWGRTRASADPEQVRRLLVESNRWRPLGRELGKSTATVEQNYLRQLAETATDQQPAVNQVSALFAPGK